MKMLSFYIFTSEMNYEEESLILEAICFNVSQLHFFHLEKLVRKINAIKIPWHFFDFERRRTRTLWTLNADVKFSKAIIKYTTIAEQRKPIQFPMSKP